MPTERELSSWDTLSLHRSDWLTIAGVLANEGKSPGLAAMVTDGLAKNDAPDSQDVEGVRVFLQRLDRGAVIYKAQHRIERGESIAAWRINPVNSPKGEWLDLSEAAPMLLDVYAKRYGVTETEARETLLAMVKDETLGLGGSEVVTCWGDTWRFNSDPPGIWRNLENAIQWMIEIKARPRKEKA